MNGFLFILCILHILNARVETIEDFNDEINGPIEDPQSSTLYPNSVTSQTNIVRGRCMNCDGYSKPKVDLASKRELFQSFRRTANASVRASLNEPDINKASVEQLRSPLRFHINEFGLNFLRQVHCTKSLGCNALHSPLSITILLSMLLHGSGHSTHQELMNFFQYSRSFNSSTQLHQAYQDLLYELGKNQRKYILRIGSLALFSDEFNPSRRFRSKVREDYHGSVLNLNFRKANQTLEVLNNWLRSITINRSQNLFTERIHPGTQLMLLNAIYFQGMWENAFQTLKEQRVFYNQLDNEKFSSSISCLTAQPKYQQSRVNTMATRGMLKHGVYLNGQLQITRLPYLGGLAMYVLLPGPESSVGQLLSNINAAQLDAWIDQLVPMELELIIPKFKMEQNYELKSILSSLGLQNLMGGRADLSRLFAENTDHADPQITSALHRAMLEVNEEGSEASASTSFKSFTVSGFPGKRIHVEKPFIFVIRDDVHAVNLFVGSLCKFI